MIVSRKSGEKMRDEGTNNDNNADRVAARFATIALVGATSNVRAINSTLVIRHVQPGCHHAWIEDSHLVLYGSFLERKQGPCF